MSQQDNGQVSQYGSAQLIPIEDIVESPFQVRIDYGDIDTLAADIKKRGLLQPILLRPVNGKKEIVHGHRRTRGMKSLGMKYIRAFVKEMSDTEAIVIQGCENLHRKDYDAIEEATLYVNYQKHMFKDTNVRVGSEEIAKEFQKKPGNVRDKMGLLDLPQSVQKKIIGGKIAVGKALRLVTLTRESSDDASSQTPRIAGLKQKHRTEAYYPQIELIVKEIEKSDKGGIRTRGGVSKVVELLKAGDSIEDAIVLAKMEESVDLAKKRAEEGKTPEEIIKEIKKTQSDPQVIIDAAINLNIENIKKQLKTEMITCPHCGKNDLEWACKHRRLVEDE